MLAECRQTAGRQFLCIWLSVLGKAWDNDVCFLFMGLSVLWAKGSFLKKTTKNLECLTFLSLKKCHYTLYGSDHHIFWSPYSTREQNESLIYFACFPCKIGYFSGLKLLGSASVMTWMLATTKLSVFSLPPCKCEKNPYIFVTVIFTSIGRQPNPFEMAQNAMSFLV